MSAKEYNRFLKKEKNRIFETHLFNWKTKEQLMSLYEEGYSPKQIAQLYQHEVGYNDLCECTSKFDGKDSKIIRVFSSFSITIFARRLLQIVPYSKKFHNIHLSKPQWWKIRFAHLDKTDDEVKEIAKNQLLDWQKSTCEKRKLSGVYNPVYTLKYWESSGDPEKSIEKYKREISPRCIEFWLKKGYDVNEAKKKIGDVCRPGATAVLKSLQGHNTSKLENRIYELLNEVSIERQMFLGRYAYDFCKKDSKKIVEINGTYWHADPRVYQNLDEKLVHGTVQEIRNKDIEKISYAKSRGWDVLVIWEIDYCKSPNEVIKSILEFFKNE